MSLISQNIWIIRVSFTLILLLGACERGSAAQWVTWWGVEADKIASIWLIQRHIDREASVVFVAPEETFPSGTLFDVPESEFRRTQNDTTFGALVRTYSLSNPVILHMSHLIHDLEINTWRPRFARESRWLDAAVRRAASNYPDNQMPAQCAVSLFDLVYAQLRIVQTERNELATPPDCVPVKSRSRESPGDR